MAFTGVLSLVKRLRMAWDGWTTLKKIEEGLGFVLRVTPTSMYAGSSLSASCEARRQKDVPVICFYFDQKNHRLTMQELAEKAASAKQEELRSAPLEKTALVEGLQKEVHTTQAATQGVLVILQIESHASMGTYPSHSSPITI